MADPGTRGAILSPVTGMVESGQDKGALPRWLWLTVATAFAIQFIVIAVFSAHEYARFDLSIDFGNSYQAVWLITHGDFNPWSTLHGYRFLDDHFALIIYPIALLYWIYPHGTLLLWLQDVAGVAAELVAARWILEICRKRLLLSRNNWVGPAIVVGASVVMLANPWFYEAMLFDFHTHVLATLFLVLTVRAAWHNRFAWAVVWAVLLLSCGDFGGLYLCGLGVSLLIVMPRRWWWGVGGLVVGFGWIRLADIMGVGNNSFMTGYAYLQTGNAAVGANVTFASLARAMVAHPQRWLRVLWERKAVIYENLIPTGVLAVVSPWSVGTTLVVIVSSALIFPLVFLQSGFQNLPAYIVGICGTVLALSWLARSRDRRKQLAALCLGLVIVSQSIIYGIVHVPKVPSQWITVSAVQATVLKEALDKTPSSAEVVADWGVIGRFSARRWVYNLNPIPGTIPLNAATVEFIVIPHQSTGNEPLPEPVADGVIDYLRTQPGMKPLAIGHGIYVYSWHPPKGQRVINIP